MRHAAGAGAINPELFTQVAKEQNAALEKSIDEQQVEIQSKEATIRSLHDALR